MLLYATPVKTFTVLSLLSFKIIWLLLVVFQNQYLLPVLAITALLILFYPDKQLAFRSLLLVGLPGICLDSLLSMTGVFFFSDTVIPLWLVALWVNFSLVLPYGFSFIRQLAISWQVLAGGLASFSYLIGWSLGAVEFPLLLFPTQILLIVIWTVLLPVFVLLINLEKKSS
jgi:hypothetical protein